MRLRLSDCNLISSTFYCPVPGSFNKQEQARAVKAFVFVCVLLVAVKCSWYQLPSVSRKEAAFVEKGAFEELCVLIIDVRHSL